MAEWRTIDSAPKDGTWFLAFPREGEGFSGVPYPPTVARLCGPYMNLDTLERDQWTVECKAMNSGSSGLDIARFTHCMPLPSPPQ